MAATDDALHALAEDVHGGLDIPQSHYDLAVQRYKSVGDWLNRRESAVAAFSPAVYPQGSFRLGTVVRPISGLEDFDLDLACDLARLTRAEVSQERLKLLVGAEVAAYTTAHSFKEPPEEKRRCWRMNYADGVNFHMDVVPAIPESPSRRDAIARLIAASGSRPELADHALGITDKRHPKYRVIDQDWPSSNPKGYALWFESVMKPVALARLKGLVERRLFASVDGVPAHAWRSPLQRAIQILKRHRDVMFSRQADLKPISIIITTLANLPLLRGVYLH